MPQEEPIGSHELRMTNREPPGNPITSNGKTNPWEVAVTRKQTLIAHALMFSVLLCIMGWCRVDEKHDIATVRAEQKASIQLVLDTLTENDKAARERGKGIAKSVDTLVGVVDTLTKGLYSTEPAPKGKR